MQYDIILRMFVEIINKIINKMENQKQSIKQKRENNFFGNVLTEYFTGQRELYIGDIDFKFADETINVIGEIKTISKSGNFEGKKISLNQIREYASMSNLRDNLGRITKTYLFEYHKYLVEPYVIAVPIIYNEKGVCPKDYININEAQMMWTHKKNQFPKWFEGTLKSSIKPQKELLCI